MRRMLSSAGIKNLKILGSRLDLGWLQTISIKLMFIASPNMTRFTKTDLMGTFSILRNTNLKY